MRRVFVIAASPLARAGLEKLLRARKVRVTGSAASLEQAAARMAESRTDVLLIDGGDEGAERISEEVAESGVGAEFPVVFLSANAGAKDTSAALRAGVRAILPRDASAEQVVAAMEGAAAGLLVLHPRESEQALRVTGQSATEVEELAEPLTPREREVLQMMAAGLGNKEIASRLGISEHTVKFHVASILGKLGASTRTEAVARGIRRGLVMI